MPLPPEPENTGPEPRPKTRVLIVDDQTSVQNIIRLGLSKDDRIDVVGAASDAYMAREMIKRLEPDILTLDIEMPRMSGLEFLERIMRLRPMPVIMFSSLTYQGSEHAVRALSLGAVDVLPKPTHGLTPDILERLSDRILNAAKRRSGTDSTHGKVAPQATTMTRWNGRIVLIGASTGGVAAVEAVLRRMPVNCPPIVISQHMPESFLKSFAARLNDILPQKVSLAYDGLELQQGHIFLSPGGTAHTGVRKQGNRLVVSAIEKPKRNGHIPSVDELFMSGAEFSNQITAVILTGIGKDGAEGMQKIRNNGAYCIGQDEASCVVYGMPRAAAELGILHQQLPLSEIAKAICESCDGRKNQRSLQ